jgi:glycosyltransferase involved in cell wall biosynthesis
VAGGEPRGSDTREPRILCFATQGEGHLDAQRLHELLEGLTPESFAFDRARRLRSALALARRVLAGRPDLVVMEGTGIAGGATLIVLNALTGARYVFSSGDAVGPYLALSSRALGTLGGVYERLLCRRCAGFIGWTPYLVGRALTLGAARAMTAAGWPREQPVAGARARIRAALGISEQALVVGIVGSLNWRSRVRYGYGAELVRAIARTDRADLVACIVGDGPGYAQLRELAGEELGRRILMPGRVPASEVADYLAAFDLASLPQSVDRVGSFRYSTKLAEYLAAGLPIITSQIPAAYDLDTGFCWRLPGSAPWSEIYVEALAELLSSLTAGELQERRGAVAGALECTFDRVAQQRRVREFIADILADAQGASRPAGARSR